MNKIILLIILILISIGIINQTTKTKEINKETCEKVNGYWNECGSACAGTDTELCIQVCVPQCECGGIAGFGCPKDYHCRLSGKIVDEMGVCIKDE